jgi:hypothetical protein
MPEKIDMIIYKLNCIKVDINDIDYQFNKYKLLKPKQTPKIIKAKLYLKKYNLLNKVNYGGE